jgi:DNA-binding transcriptional ArsR family regulator
MGGGGVNVHDEIVDRLDYSHFAYHQTMPAHSLASHPESLLSQVAAAIGEPARTRMLCCLMDGHARTATELGVVAQVSPSTASVHLAKLKASHLVDMVAQGKHRYFRLSGPQVGTALEALLVLAGAPSKPFVPGTPSRLRAARTCYDHLAGTLAVALHDHFVQQGWLQPCGTSKPGGYQLSIKGETHLAALGVDVPMVRAQRRRFAYACMDWSERKPHIGGALGAALLNVSLAHGWLHGDLDSRAVSLTDKGRRAFQTRFAIDTQVL